MGSSFFPIFFHLLSVPVSGLLLFFIVDSCLGNPDWYTTCNTNFVCGNIIIGYPFWGNERSPGCGIPELELKCQNDTTTIQINGLEYKILNMDEKGQILKIAREDYTDNGLCGPEFMNTTLDPDIFEYASGYRNLTIIYGCPVNGLFGSSALLSCDISGSTFNSGFAVWEANGPGLCYASVFVPVSIVNLGTAVFSSTILEESLKQGFEVKWKLDYTACADCISSKGVCGYGYDQTICYCPGQLLGSKTCTSSSSSSDTWPVKQGGKSKSVSLGIGLGIAGAAVVGIGLGCWFLLIVQKRKRIASQTQTKDLQTPPPNKGQAVINFSQNTPSYNPSSKSDLEKGSTYFGAQVFSYDELVQATDNFDPSKELGDGGFGTVYYGILNDGRVVAIKRLFDNNIRRAEQFMNEVEILTRLRHKNLVSLYGCTSKRSQELILVYEYVPNGTIADHIHGNRSQSGLVPWRVRLSIAIETADALAYLHASDIIHRDVKSNNILLDNEFHVKVADFGLSRLFPNDVSHVSTAPQGTPGYVDPEYYQCYQLTDKSDVYSFGVVLTELISSLQAVDTSRDRLDINLANMAVNKIQNHLLNELVDPMLGFEKDYAVRKMVTAVAELAFRCLQQEKDMRPKMGEVLVALKKIETENYGSDKAEIVDVKEDDVGLLDTIPPFSPDSGATDKWVSSSTTTNTSF